MLDTQSSPISVAGAHNLVVRLPGTRCLLSFALLPDLLCSEFWGSFSTSDEGHRPQYTVMWTGCNVVFRILICTSNTGTLKDGGVPVGLFSFLGEGSLFAWEGGGGLCPMIHSH
jgi:hypothetical protein